MNAPSRTEVGSHLSLGRYGEQLAANYLKNLDYRIVVTNFLAPIGYRLQGRPVTGEIDIIAYDEASPNFTLAFIEVKTRSSARIAAPEAAVDLRKQRQIIKAARIYRRMMDVNEESYRYDVVSVLVTGGETEVNLLRGYFSEERFGRSVWQAQQV